MIWPALILAAFLVGFVPMWLSKRTVAYELDQTRHQLRRAQLQNQLSTATVYARRGEYETGRQNASSFFSELQSELNNSDSSILTATEKTQVPGILSGRDDTITLLSRSDPASADRLSDLYVAYRSVTAATPPQ